MAEQHKTTSQPDTATGRKRISRSLRRCLLLLGPTLLATGAAWIYWTGGRYVSTDNAYVQADTVIISGEVSGPITMVSVADNRHVAKGDPLFTIDQRPYAIAEAQHRAQLQEVMAEIRTLKARYRQKLSERELARSNIDFADREYQRQATLAGRRVVSEAKLDDARHTLAINRQQLTIINDELSQILARLEGDPDADPERLAEYRLAAAKQAEAELDLERTVVRAPFAGIVSKTPRPGKHVAPGAAVMALVADEGSWIDANFKETELTHVHAGQPVRIEIDTYPDAVLAGVVDSISPATGSSFSVIPAQNATGNWVKVVQRIPVRISITSHPEELALRTGMSAVVRIDTGHQRGLPPGMQKVLAAFGLGGGEALANADRR